jgi:hypothetical protein
MITAAERRFPVRIRIGVAPGGLRPAAYSHYRLARRELRRRRLGDDAIGNAGVLDDSRSICFFNPTLASAFVARWWVGTRVEASGGVFQVREDEPVPGSGQ